MATDIATVGKKQPSPFRFNVEKLQVDIARRGWNQPALARAAGLSVMTVSRFLKGKPQTPKTCKCIADALGYSVARYLIS